MSSPSGPKRRKLDSTSQPLLETPKSKRIDSITSPEQRPPAQGSQQKPVSTRDFFKQFHKPKASAGEPPADVGIGKSFDANAVTRVEQEEVLKDESPELEEEAGVRTSGRARRLPAKLRQSNDALSTSPTMSAEKRRKTPKAAPKEQAVVSQKEVRNSVKRKDKYHVSQDVAAGKADPGRIDSAPRSTKTRDLATKPLDRRKQATTNDYVTQAAGGAQDDDMDIDQIGEADRAKTTSKQQSHPVNEQRSDTIPSTPSAKSKKKLVISSDFVLEAEQTKSLQSVILAKACGKRPIPLMNLEDQFSKVSTVISQTITAGEGNSVLLIGSRGSGKSAMVNQILREQHKKHADDFHVIRLNGFIHTDDKLALREIWRQLGREMELGEEETSTRSYSDTLSTLLALLSHPAELGQTTEPDHLTKSVIFILDEFELFASHPRQTLLYNLFDIAQSRKAPIAVLGLTTRIDVAESLEKRVKSRFSHRYVHLSLAKSFHAFLNVVTAALTVQTEELTAEENASLTESSAPVKTSKGQATPVSGLDKWNACMELLCSSEDFLAHLHRLYYTTKSIPDFLANMLVPLATLPTASPLQAQEVIDHITSTMNPSTQGPDSKLDLISSLSALQLSLLICAARQTAIHSTELVSFNLAYEEYKVLASKAKLQATASGAVGAGSRIWGKDIARNAWAELVSMGFLIEDGRGGARVDVALEEISSCGIDLGQWARWCKEI